MTVSTSVWECDNMDVKKINMRKMLKVKLAGHSRRLFENSDIKPTLKIFSSVLRFLRLCLIGQHLLLSKCLRPGLLAVVCHILSKNNNSLSYLVEVLYPLSLTSPACNGKGISADTRCVWASKALSKGSLC